MPSRPWPRDAKRGHGSPPIVISGEISGEHGPRHRRHLSDLPVSVSLADRTERLEEVSTLLDDAKTGGRTPGSRRF
jgi:hypothetical protein